MFKTIAVVLVLVAVSTAKYVPQASEPEPSILSFPSLPAVPEIQSVSASSYGEPASASYPPQPYSFGFETLDSYGTTVKRQESGDGSGVVRGSYTITDGKGLSRTVDYIADAYGFRATVRSNEPGVQKSRPADVVLDGPEVAYGSGGAQAAPSYSSPPSRY